MNNHEKFLVYFFQNNINIAGYEASNVFALSCLHWIIRLLIVIAKIECKCVGRSCPFFNTLKRIDVQKFLGFLVDPQYGLLGNAQQTSYKFVLAFHFFFDKKKGHAIGLERPTELGVFKLGLQFGETVQIRLELVEYLLLNSFHFDIFYWQILF